VALAHIQAVIAQLHLLRLKSQQHWPV